MRRQLLGLLVLIVGLLSMVWAVNQVDAQAQETCVAPTFTEIGFGRVLTETQMMSGAGVGVSLVELMPNDEFFVGRAECDQQGGLWYRVQPFTSGARGWVRADTVELAAEGSNLEVRLYGSDQMCYLTPTALKAPIEVTSDDLVNHQLVFGVSEVGTDVQFFFEGQPLEADVVERQPNEDNHVVFGLSFFWVSRHPRSWNEQANWLLMAPCIEVTLPPELQVLVTPEATDEFNF